MLHSLCMTQNLFAYLSNCVHIYIWIATSYVTELYSQSPNSLIHHIIAMNLYQHGVSFLATIPGNAVIF